MDAHIRFDVAMKRYRLAGMAIGERRGRSRRPCRPCEWHYATRRVGSCSIRLALTLC